MTESELNISKTNGISEHDLHDHFEVGLIETHIFRWLGKTCLHYLITVN